jgi:hypothetical protein
MTLRPGEVAGRSFAVFPFLKTSEPIGLGSFAFRSTEDTTGLSDDDSAHLKEIAGMLFLQERSLHSIGNVRDLADSQSWLAEQRRNNTGQDSTKDC